VAGQRLPCRPHQVNAVGESPLLHLGATDGQHVLRQVYAILEPGLGKGIATRRCACQLQDRGAALTGKVEVEWDVDLHIVVLVIVLGIVHIVWHVSQLLPEKST